MAITEVTLLICKKMNIDEFQTSWMRKNDVRTVKGSRKLNYNQSATNPFSCFWFQTIYHTILSAFAKTILFLVKCYFFPSILKFEKFSPSWFMAAS